MTAADCLLLLLVVLLVRLCLQQQGGTDGMLKNDNVGRTDCAVKQPFAHTEPCQTQKSKCNMKCNCVYCHHCCMALPTNQLLDCLLSSSPQTHCQVSHSPSGAAGACIAAALVAAAVDDADVERQAAAAHTHCCSCCCEAEQCCSSKQLSLPRNIVDACTVDRMSKA
jgi:hypothetical protein